LTKKKKDPTIVVECGVKSEQLGSEPLRLDDNSVTILNIAMENSEDEPGEQEYNNVMNMEDFLAENNITMEIFDEQSNSKHTEEDVKPPPRPSIIVGPKKRKRPSNEDIFNSILNEYKTSSDEEEKVKKENSFLYAESKRARIDREKEEKRRRLEMAEFDAQDLALATVPGVDFDPKERTFDMEELRPQPIIRKRRKHFVQPENKDEQYWDKREKNNMAARRSREARRLKENQIALRAAFLERENSVLKGELEDSHFGVTKLQNERDILKRKLSQFEPVSA